jgi:hypothetical protein
MAAVASFMAAMQTCNSLDVDGTGFRVQNPLKAVSSQWCHFDASIGDDGCFIFSITSQT